MAPVVAEAWATALRESVRLDKRAVTMSDLHNQTTNSHQTITDAQTNVLQVLALVFSSFSVASAVLAFYWFMKMRRSFRHDLIMLLIQSDMFKALWFMVYPIITFTSGPVLSHSTFCQVNGFFLAIGIEASDFSVLMIAIHSALYIFRPKNSNGEGGLYPYRNIAYISYIVFPILMAGLAFVNHEDAYVSDGTYCYLPVRPFWYRLALGWIPRYLIFIIILGIYASIYFYVRYKFVGFAEQNQSLPNDETVDGTRAEGQSPQPLPTTPPLACHGLIPMSRQASASDGEVVKASRPEFQRKDSLPRKDSFARRGSVHQFMILASFTNRVQPQIPSPTSELSISDSDSFMGPATPQPLPPYVDATPASPESTHSIKSVTPSKSRKMSWRDNFVTRYSPDATEPVETPAQKPSVVDIFTILRRNPDHDTETSTPISQLHLTNSRGDNVVDMELLRTRDKIRRQLRFLFIYPLVYIGMWIVPFVSHVMQYDDRYAINPPFGLTCVTTICVCMQAAVDCWLFSTREKPWRHIPDTNGGFWESLRFWTGWRGVTKRKVVRGPGKTREEMVKEARSAYRRRDEELAQRRNQAEAQAAAAANANQASTTAAAPLKKGERSWWDGRASLDGAGGSSPVAEEQDPMERDRSQQLQMEEVGSMTESDATLRNLHALLREMQGEDVETIDEEDAGLEIPSRNRKKDEEST